MIKVRVPASTANLGVGFDSIGLAFDLYNEFIFECSEEDELVNFKKEHCYNNLVLKSYSFVFEYLKIQRKGVKITLCVKNVPEARGLGSSSTCIVAGVFGANCVLNNMLSKEECLKIATIIEGHPDNVAPCIYGGLVSSFVNGDNVYATKYKVNSSLKFYALIPSFSLSTSLSRKALPDSVKMKDAINNISRAINLPYYFGNGDLKMIRLITKDALHEPYRYRLIENAINIKKYFEEKEFAINISGAGPTLLVIMNEYIDVSLLEKEIANITKDDKWSVKEMHINEEGVRCYYE